MWSKLPLLHSCPGGVRKSTFHGPWQIRSKVSRTSAWQQVLFYSGAAEDCRIVTACYASASPGDMWGTKSDPLSRSRRISFSKDVLDGNAGSSGAAAIGKSKTCSPRQINSLARKDAVFHNAPKVPFDSFTLLELLLVIAIVGILAALLVPVFGKVQRSLKIARAKQEMAILISAVNAYYSTYSQLPAPPEAAKGGGDFTFGNVGREGKGFAPSASPFPLPKIINTSEAPGPPCILCPCPTVGRGPRGLIAAPYQANNAALVAILRDLEHYRLPGAIPTCNFNHARNPKRKVFLNAKDSAGVLSPGVGDDLVYRDPWGNPYIVTLDLNYDDACRDAFYRMAHLVQLPPPDADSAKGLLDSFRAPPPCFHFPTDSHPGDRHGFLLRGRIIVWSFGPDGKTDYNWENSPAQKADAGDNKDNVLSWR